MGNKSNSTDKDSSSRPVDGLLTEFARRRQPTVAYARGGRCQQHNQPRWKQCRCFDDPSIESKEICCDQGRRILNSNTLFLRFPCRKIWTTTTKPTIEQVWNNWPSALHFVVHLLDASTISTQRQDKPIVMDAFFSIWFGSKYAFWYNVNRGAQQSFGHFINDIWWNEKSPLSFLEIYVSWALPSQEWCQMVKNLSRPLTTRKGWCIPCGIASDLRPIIV